MTTQPNAQRSHMGDQNGVWTERYRSCLMDTFGPPQLVLATGEGALVRDLDGREYLDLLGGIAVNILGHAHPALIEAVSTQVGRLAHVSNFFATTPQIRLAERLLQIAGGDSGLVFLTNSGTEANEAALKLVKAHGNAAATEGGEPKQRILALEHAFHGRSTGALALTWKAAYREPFTPLMPGVEFIPAGDIAALEAAMGPDVAGVFVEPIQGEAGVLPLDAEYLQAVRALCTEHDAIMVADEVQTGIGRTGTWLAMEAAGVRADVTTLAKGLGGGMPIGACLAFGTAATVLGPGMHGTTFGGNPVCAAAGLAVLETVENDGLLEHAATLGEQWRADLWASGTPGLVDVRGRGLLIGLDFDRPIAPALVAKARSAGFIINATGPATVRLAPPLVLTGEQAGRFTAALPALVRAVLEADDTTSGGER